MEAVYVCVQFTGIVIFKVDCENFEVCNKAVDTKTENTIRMTPGI